MTQEELMEKTLQEAQDLYDRKKKAAIKYAKTLEGKKQEEYLKFVNSEIWRVR